MQVAELLLTKFNAAVNALTTSNATPLHYVVRAALGESPEATVRDRVLRVVRWRVL